MIFLLKKKRKEKKEDYTKKSASLRITQYCCWLHSSPALFVKKETQQQMVRFLRTSNYYAGG